MGTNKQSRVIIMARRVFEKWTPKTVKGIGSVEFFKSDIDYIQTHGYSVSAVMREALHAHVLTMQAREALPVMDKQTRDNFVMRGILPRGVVYTPKKDPGVYFKPEPASSLLLKSPERIKGPSPSEMLSWSRQDRDKYILTGQVPA